MASPHIISASRRTDIPAFYSAWLERRIAQGWCAVRNPVSGALSEVSLRPADVLAWVFWSRHYRPLWRTLEALDAQGIRFLCHYTITGCPRSLDARSPASRVAIETAHALTGRFGESVVQWRYDPILLTDATPPDWHLENCRDLAIVLRGATRRCIIEFPTMYRKTRRNLEALQRAGGPRVWSSEHGDFTRSDLESLLAQLADITSEQGIEMQACCGPEWVSQKIRPAHCIDWPLLRDLGGGEHLSDLSHDLLGPEVPEVPLQGTRPECGCYASRDIGAYETCTHGCAYCYAVNRPEKAREYRRTHDPDAPEL